MEFLSPTEAQQDRDHGPWVHFCKRYKEKVYHFDFHPNLVRLKWCKFGLEEEESSEVE